MPTPAALLFAPESYWTLDPVAKDQLVNGCGPRGWLAWLVPDTNWGLVITPVCNIHDYMYAIGRDEADRVEADQVFLNNHLRWIDAMTSLTVLRRLRYRRAQHYYVMVRNYGGPAFWDGKNPVDTMQLVTV